MANVRALRDKVVELASDKDGPLRGRWNPNDLHARVAQHFEGSPPVARGTFYKWFGATRAAPSQTLMELVPAFAEILGVREYELWQVAGVLVPPVDTSFALASAAHDIRSAYRRMSKTLAQSGLSTAGEALLVDRILHAKLDYQMRVWPVVRGHDRPLHLHSWLLVEPVPAAQSTRRAKTARVEALDPRERRRYFRAEVISEGVWRSLGLQWRERIPADFGDLGPEPLFIEIPVEERNRTPSADGVHAGLRLDSLLVLAAPWAHGELMAALLAEALRFGSWDLRYVGHRPETELADKERFCRERLREARRHHVWAISQGATFVERLRPAVVAAARRHLVVVLTYGPRTARFAGRALGMDEERVHAALGQLKGLAAEIGDAHEVVRVHVDDADVLADPTAREPDVDRDRMVDHMRRLTARVLNLIFANRDGPPIELWGDRFEDLRVGDQWRAVLPECACHVGWARPGGR